MRATINDYLPVYTQRRGRNGRICTFRATTNDLLAKEFYVYDVKEDMLEMIAGGELYRLTPTGMPHTYTYELAT